MMVGELLCEAPKSRFGFWCNFLVLIACLRFKD
jgi:hypothetical protein